MFERAPFLSVPVRTVVALSLGISQGDLDPSAGLCLLSSVRAPGMGGHEMTAGDAWDNGCRSRQKGSGCRPPF